MGFVLIPIHVTKLCQRLVVIPFAVHAGEVCLWCLFYFGFWSLSCSLSTFMLGGFEGFKFSYFWVAVLLIPFSLASSFTNKLLLIFKVWTLCSSILNGCLFIYLTQLNPDHFFFLLQIGVVVLIFIFDFLVVCLDGNL